MHPYSTTGNRAIEYRGRPNTIFDQQLAGLDSVRPIRDYFEVRNIELSDFEPDHNLITNPNGAADVAARKLMRQGQDEFLYRPVAFMFAHVLEESGFFDQKPQSQPIFQKTHQAVPVDGPR